MPTLGVYLLEHQPANFDWECRWVPWPDWGLPVDDQDARRILEEAWSRSAEERVEIACLAGCGRTGTALACIAVFDGVPANQAVEYVRRNYNSEAVETADQRLYVENLST
jgi:protein-tyrosine phosphatase